MEKVRENLSEDEEIEGKRGVVLCLSAFKQKLRRRESQVQGGSSHINTYDSVYSVHR